MRFSYLSILWAGAFSTIAFASPCRVNQILQDVYNFGDIRDAEARQAMSSYVKKSIMSVIDHKTMVCTEGQITALLQVVDNHIYYIRGLQTELELKGLDNEEPGMKPDEDSISADQEKEGEKSKNKGDNLKDEQELNKGQESESQPEKTAASALYEEFQDMVNFRFDSVKASSERITNPKHREKLQVIVDALIKIEDLVHIYGNKPINTFKANFEMVRALSALVKAVEYTTPRLKKLQQADPSSGMNAAGQMYALVAINRRNIKLMQELGQCLKTYQLPVPRTPIPSKEGVLWSGDETEYVVKMINKLKLVMSIRQQQSRKAEEFFVKAFNSLAEDAGAISKRLAIMIKKTGETTLKASLTELNILTQQLTSRIVEWKYPGKISEVKGPEKLSLQGKVVQKGM